ncbi:MAG: protease modulator HflK [Planctomycetota bacterium]
MMARRHSQPVIFQGMEVGLKMFRWVVVLMLLLFLGSGITQIKSEGVGLQLRFGRLLGPPHEPGLLLALPFPIDQVIQVPTQHEGEVVIEELWRDVSGGAGQDDIDPTVEGYCVTGDQNIVQARIVAKYRVVDPIRFKLEFVDPEKLLRDVVMAATNYTIAGWKVDDVLRLQQPLAEASGATQRLDETVRAHAQKQLNELDVGLRLLTIEFKEIHPPRHVVAAFREVQSAKINIQTEQREAEGFYASEIPKAETKKNRMIQEASAYQSSAVAEAEAENAVFRELFAEYQKNPDLVRQRIFMETFEAMLANAAQVRFVAPHTRLIVSDQTGPEPEGE